MQGPRDLVTLTRPRQPPLCTVVYKYVLPVLCMPCYAMYMLANTTNAHSWPLSTPNHSDVSTMPANKRKIQSSKICVWDNRHRNKLCTFFTLFFFLFPHCASGEEQSVSGWISPVHSCIIETMSELLLFAVCLSVVNASSRWIIHNAAPQVVVSDEGSLASRDSSDFKSLPSQHWSQKFNTLGS